MLTNSKLDTNLIGSAIWVTLVQRINGGAESTCRYKRKHYIFFKLNALGKAVTNFSLRSRDDTNKTLTMEEERTKRETSNKGTLYIIEEFEEKIELIVNLKDEQT